MPFRQSGMAATPGSARGAPKSLMARAVGLLARREHSRAELARKLQRYLEPDDDASDIDRVLDVLQAQNLLSDARFASALVGQRAPRYGDLRVRRDLRDRGVEPVEADAAMEKLRGTEAARAYAVWARRFAALPGNADERGRQGRYLQARGFSMDAIVQVLAGKAGPSP